MIFIESISSFSPIVVKNEELGSLLVIKWVYLTRITMVSPFIIPMGAMTVLALPVVSSVIEEALIVGTSSSFQLSKGGKLV